MGGFEANYRKNWGFFEKFGLFEKVGISENIGIISEKILLKFE
jgi:hypothetical protein